VETFFEALEEEERDDAAIEAHIDASSGAGDTLHTSTTRAFRLTKIHLGRTTTRDDQARQERFR